MILGSRKDIPIKRRLSEMYVRFLCGFSEDASIRITPVEVLGSYDYSYGR
jgi:hypothetical protein